MLFEVSGGISHDAVPESIPHSEVEGLRIRIDQVARNPDGTVGFRLLLSFSVPAHLRDCHPEPMWAFHAIARDLRSGKVEAVSLRDPNVVPLEMPDPNFREVKETPDRFALGTYVIPMLLGVGQAEDHPGVLVHVALHD
ncbi:MAG: hypothetical protein JST92_25060, partial [Deltaproteobacteria bacterium]|nr:hypothetical protein [Deltaproteobacteria bacterium]